LSAVLNLAVVFLSDEVPLSTWVCTTSSYTKNFGLGFARENGALILCQTPGRQFSYNNIID